MAEEVSADAGTVDPGTLRDIRAILSDLEDSQSVRVLFAVESGSRAWGFPSPDSDYDCRFVFVRRRASYLSLWPERDVIEVPLDGLLDVNGWDLSKAIRLLCKGNAVLLEWLNSPIIYHAERGVRESLRDLARSVVNRDQVARHYLHLGEEQVRRHLARDEGIPLKKIFYALRPAVALRWFHGHAAPALPPMNLLALMEQSRMPADVAAFTTELIARKSVSRELGTGNLPAAMRLFIEGEFAVARDAFGRGRREPSTADRTAADSLFGEMLDAFG